MTTTTTTQVAPFALKVAQEQPGRLASAIYRAASTMAPEARTEANQLCHLFLLAAEGTIAIHALRASNRTRPGAR